jgi:hypothetical protein
MEERFLYVKSAHGLQLVNLSHFSLVVLPDIGTNWAFTGGFEAVSSSRIVLDIVS